MVSKFTNLERDWTEEEQLEIASTNNQTLHKKLICYDLSDNVFKTLIANASDLIIGRLKHWYSIQFKRVTS
jgi:hypothetical protein